jgi:hypothetical protein
MHSVLYFFLLGKELIVVNQGRTLQSFASPLGVLHPASRRAPRFGRAGLWSHVSLEPVTERVDEIFRALA